MTTTITAPPAATRQSRRDPRVTTPRVIASEWIKFRTLRSTLITLALTVTVVIGLGLIVSSVTGHSTGNRGPGSAVRDPTSISLTGLSLAALAVAVLGVLTSAGEYSTGSIRSTLTAVPARLPVLWAKAIVVASVTFLAMTVAVFVAFGGGQALLAAAGHTSASLSDPGVLRAVIGAAGYLAGASLIGLAVGALLRNTAGAVATVIGALFVLPGLVQALPNSWNAVTRYLPSNAASAFTSVHHATSRLSPLPGVAVYVAYIAVLLTAAALLLKRRDA
jgi:ABC-2 type transport system permease protein